VAARFAILEAALLLGEVVTGWDAQTCRDAIQHSYNAWLREFGTGNKEHQQIIEQTEAFLNAHGLSRYAPLGYDPRDLPIRDLPDTGRRKSRQRPDNFLHLPGDVRAGDSQGFNAKQFAEY
jgi:putative DNA primase/helicase